jgi:hypothetical protein
VGLLDKQEATQEEKIHDLRTSITKLSLKMHNKMLRQHQQLWNLVWNNSNGLTAQEVFDEYGSDSAQFFLISQAIQTMLVQVDSSYVPLVPDFPYEINPDGTVTVDYSDVS